MLKPPDMNVETVHASEGADAVVRAPWPEGARVLKDHVGGTVWRAEVAGREVVAKVRPLSGARRRAQRLLGATPLRRAWRDAGWLRANGFAAAEPLVLVEGESGGVAVECLFVEAVDGPTLLRTLVDDTVLLRSLCDYGHSDHFARAFGVMAGQLYKLGRWNRDAKPSNLILRQNRDLVVVDADLRRIPPGLEALERSLAAVLIETAGVGGPDVSYFVRSAAVAAVSELLTGCAQVTADEFAERIVRGALRRAGRHKDPRPKNDPLAHEREEGADAVVPQRDAVNA